MGGVVGCGGVGGGYKKRLDVDVSNKKLLLNVGDVPTIS